MKAEIQQEHYLLIDIQHIEKDIVEIWQNGDVVQVEIENLKQLALILCPELSQPELKAVKTAEEILDENLIIVSPFGTATVRNPNVVKALIKSMHEYANQFSQPKEEQPEKIVSELPILDEFTKVVMRERDWQLEVVVPDLEKQISELKSEVERLNGQLRENRTRNNGID